MNRVKYLDSNGNEKHIRVWQGGRKGLYLPRNRFAKNRRIRPTVKEADAFAAKKGWMRKNA